MSIADHNRISLPEKNKVQVCALIKGAERYVFMFDSAHKGEVLRIIGKFAGNPPLSFTWYDAAKLCQKIRGV